MLNLQNSQITLLLHIHARTHAVKGKLQKKKKKEGKQQRRAEARIFGLTAPRRDRHRPGSLAPQRRLLAPNRPPPPPRPLPPPSPLLLLQQRATGEWRKARRERGRVPRFHGLARGGEGSGPTCSACSGKDSAAPTTTLALASSFSARSMLATHCRGERNGALAAPLPDPPDAAPSRRGGSAPLGGGPRLAAAATPRPGAYPVPGPEVPHALGPQRPSAPVHQHPARRGHARCPPRSGAAFLRRRLAWPPGPAGACGLAPARGGRGAAAPGPRWRGGKAGPAAALRGGGAVPAPGKGEMGNGGAWAGRQPAGAQGAPPRDFHLRNSSTRARSACAWPGAKAAGGGVPVLGGRGELTRPASHRACLPSPAGLSSRGGPRYLPPGDAARVHSLISGCKDPCRGLEWQ